LSENQEKSSYAAAGVDTHAGERAVDLMRSAIAKVPIVLKLLVTLVGLLGYLISALSKQ
jgi:hypothetical protein